MNASCFETTQPLASVQLSFRFWHGKNWRVNLPRRPTSNTSRYTVQVLALRPTEAANTTVLVLETMTDENRRTSSDDVGNQVLAIPELLESILLYLPVVDVLVNAQRVNRFWNHTMKKSIKLQQAVFLKPLCADVRLLNMQSRSLDDASTQKGRAEPDADRTWIMQGNIAMNPLACHLKVMSGAIWAAAPLHPKYMRSEASWRRMLITQPPIAFSVGRTGVVTFGDLMEMRAADIWVAQIFGWIASIRMPSIAGEVAAIIGV